MKHLLAAAALIALPTPCALAQTAAPATSTSSLPASAAYVATMTFDVASVRQTKDVDVIAGFRVSGGPVPHTTSFRAVNWRIENLITFAYGVDLYQVEGAPRWPWPTLFVIQAKGDSDADAKMATLTSEQQRAEQRHMLQALLEDRFKLKTHWETKEGDVYHLVVAKGGPKLSAKGSTPPSAEELKYLGDRPIPPLYQRNDGQGYDFVAHGCSLGQLVKILSGQFGRPVIDETGLTGNYDFVLKYRGRWDRDRNADDLDPTPPLDLALKDELGLKIEAAKAPVKMLVIDHIEKPSEN
ncbi:MAG: TIGR03435 family protein [Terracidiphilus sp.]